VRARKQSPWGACIEKWSRQLKHLASLTRFYSPTHSCRAIS
jgi:hypothetical protein